MLPEPSTAIGTQRRGMDGLQHEVLLPVDHISLATGKASPEHIDDVMTMSGKSLDGRISKLLPS